MSDSVDDNWPWFDIHNPMNVRMSQRMTVEELEEILLRDDDEPLEILPNGKIRRVGGSTLDETGGKRPLSFRENLGGEYA